MPIGATVGAMTYSSAAAEPAPPSAPATNKTLFRVVVTARVLLALVFIFYGGIKLLGGQYYYGDWTISKNTTDGTSLVWAFYGYSPIYGRFTGLFELIPALMLLFGRTATLGAMALFAVGLNITVMDFCYHYPEVKYFILAYTLIAAGLVCYDRQRLRLMTARPAEVSAAAHALTRRR